MSDTSTMLLRWGMPTPCAVADGPKTPRVLSTPPAFPYVRQALTLDGFRRYIAAYDFGSIPPDYIVLHHTAIPSFAQWTADETGMGDDARRAKRLQYLDSIKRYYNESLGWSSGPHLFIDDRWIYLMTPMYDPGTHAAAGNQTNAGGRLHYSIGVEVVGDYTRTAWPAAIERMVTSAIAMLQKQLGTFAIVDKSGPGGICGHRCYNKPACPGAKITPSYYLPLITAARKALDAPPPITRYRVPAVPIYQRQDLTGPIAAWLETGDVVAIDKTYDNGAGHLQNELGFIRLEGLERL